MPNCSSNRLIDFFDTNALIEILRTEFLLSHWFFWFDSFVLSCRAHVLLSEITRAEIVHFSFKATAFQIRIWLSNHNDASSQIVFEIDTFAQWSTHHRE
jgi:predicted nucleic acid-binding protein